MIFPHLSNTIEYSYNFYALRHLINIMNSFAVYYISPKFLSTLHLLPLSIYQAILSTFFPPFSPSIKSPPSTQNACNTILQRLEPYIASNPKGSWDDWVKAAYFDRVSLSATGFYK